MIWCNTSFVPEKAPGRFVGDDDKYNKVAAKVMARHGIETDDLYTLTKSFAEKYSNAPGDVHFTKKGYQQIAKQVASTIERALSKKAKP